MAESLKKKAPTIKTTWSCLKYAVGVLNLPNKGIMKAKDYPVNSQTPKIGSLLISMESSYGHASVPIEIISDTKIRVIEANYIPGKRGERVIDTTKVKIKGYYVP